MRPDIKPEIRPINLTRPAYIAPRQSVTVSHVQAADSVRFSGKTSVFSAAEAAELAKVILPAGTAEQQAAVTKAINTHQPLGLDGEYVYGFIGADGSIKSDSDKFRKIATHLKESIPAEAIPKTGLPLAVEVRNEKTFANVQEFLEKEVIPTFQFHGQVVLPGKGLFKKAENKTVDVFESAAWPFFQSVIAGEPLPEKIKGLGEKLHALPFFKLQTSHLSNELGDKLNTAFEPLRIRLAAVETARMQYTERVDVKEVVKSLAKGAAVGGGGETLIHFGVHDGGTMAALMRTGLLVVVDTVDNVYGEMGVLHSDLEANGLKMSKETVFGEKSWAKIFKNRFKMKGPGGIFAKRAASSAVKGAAIGSATAAPVAFVLSDPNASVLARAAVGGPGTLGTAMAIPVNIRATLPQVYYTIKHLIDDGKINVPAAIKADPKKLDAHIAALSKQELLSRLGFSASMKAFSLVPLSGGVLGLEAVGVPREICQIVFMGIAPAMENLLRLVITLGQLKNNGNRMDHVEDMILNSAKREFTDKETHKLQRFFADGWSQATSWILTHIPSTKKYPAPISMKTTPMPEPMPEKAEEAAPEKPTT